MGKGFDRRRPDRLLSAPGQAMPAKRGETLADNDIRGARALSFGSGEDVLQGLYKFSFQTAQGSGHGVMFATEAGRLYGGDNGSCFAGRFQESQGRISAELMMSRHNHDGKFVPMFSVDNVMLRFDGTRRGDEVHFSGGTDA